MYVRQEGLVEGRVAEEQYGFRKGRGCTDAINALRMVVEKSAECGEKQITAALDVEKAFNRVHHADLGSMEVGEKPADLTITRPPCKRRKPHTHVYDFSLLFTP